MSNSIIPNYAQTMAGPHRDGFIKAITKAYNSLNPHKLFAWADRPDGFKPLDTKLVLKLKETASVSDSLAFLRQRFPTNPKRQLFETFAPVATFKSLRAFMSLCMSLDLEVDQVYVIAAFLNAKCEEKIYVRVPDGYSVPPGNEGKSLRLLKTLYGIKQAPHGWNHRIDTLLKSLVLSPTVPDRCIYCGVINEHNALCYFILTMFLFQLPIAPLCLCVGRKHTKNACIDCMDC